MPPIYTTAEKVQIVKWYFGGNSVQDTRNLFIVAFADRPVPTEATVLSIINKFQNFGCVAAHCKKCCPTNPPPHPRQIPEEREIRETQVCALAETTPCSSRQIADEVNLNERTVRNILKRNGYHCFKVMTTQELLPGDHFRRMEFCETMVEKCNRAFRVNDDFLKKVLFTDESSFSIHRKHNPSVVRYWSRKNKHLSIAVRTQYPSKLNVWTGLLGDHVIGPFFIEGNLNAAKYLQLLQNQIIPAVRALPIDFNDVWFQQDGCPAHNAGTVVTFLNQLFPDRLICTRGTINWPPRSPDLAPLDFYFWGMLKSEVYRHEFERATNLDELRAKIIQLCAQVTPVTLAATRTELYNRFGYCLAQNGGLFEHLIQ